MEGLECLQSVSVRMLVCCRLVEERKRGRDSDRKMGRK